jgi:hypothetical protein
VQQVRVDREGRLAALVLADRDLMLLGKVEQLFAAGIGPFPPGRDDADVRLQRVIAELEADLVVALAGGAVTHRVAPTARAISIWRLAISGRAIEVPSRYWPS